MIEAIAHLRKIADEVEALARKSGMDPAARAEMIDMAARWQYLAGEAAWLCNRTEQLRHGRTDCTGCAEGCLRQAG
jgi:pyruvate-formate lyase